ncbi:uncharacterized protein LOC103831432 [Brassica rapa]|nr:uncharacterized protein LOC103831432 [Brassica rapa]
MDFHGMKRRKLQLLCKKHGIPANLKNVEMANRLVSLFTDQTSPVRTRTMSDILSRCSVIESRRDEASADDGTLVTSEYKSENSTVEEEEEMEISKENCTSVGHCVSNPESELGMPNEMELSANRHGDLSEEQADICKVGCLSVGHCVNRESLDEVNALSQHVPVNNAASSVLDDEGVFITPERKLMMMEQLSQNAKTCAAESVNHHSDEVVESHGVVFTTPEQVLLMGDSGREEVGKQEEHTSTESPVESDVLKNSQNGGVSVKKPAQFNEEVGLSSEMHKAAVESPDESDVPGRHPFPEESELEEAAKSEEYKAVESQVDCDNFSGNCHDMFDVVTASESQSIMGNFEAPTARKQEQDEVEFKDESTLFTSFERCLLLGESAHDRLGNSKSGTSQFQSPHDSSPKVGLKENSVVWGSHALAVDLGENTIRDSSGSIASKVFMPKDSLAENVDSVIDTIMECNPESELFVETSPSPSLVQLAESLPTCPILVEETVSTLIAEEDSKNNEEIVLKEHRFLAKLAEAEAVLENSDVFTTPERNLMMMEQVSQNEKTLAADSVNHQSGEAVESSYAVVFTTPEQVLLLGDYWIDEVGKQADSDNFTGANITTECHDMSNVLSASESQSIMGDFEPHIAGNQEREEVEFKEESAAFFTKFETCLLLGESAHDILGNNMSGLSPHDSSAIVILKDDSMDVGDNTVAVSSGSFTSNVSYSHEFNAGEETAGACLDASQGPTKQSKRDSPHVDSANPFDLDLDGADTTMDAERNVSFSSYVLAGTCSLVPEESSPSTNIHDQINDALEELAITDELIETKVTTQKDDKGMLDSSGGSSA